MNNKYFIYTGNAYPHKNLSRLIEAMVFLNKNRKEKIILKICSSRNVFTERLQNLVKDNNAQEYVELLGFVPDPEMKDLYKNSVAFVFPTLSEGFGLPPIEAIEAGTLVVLSDIPVLKEVYQKSAIYFDPLNAESITQTLERVVNIPLNEREKRITFAKSFIKQYSWSKMARQTLQIYESLV